jgi:hypothetical protein
MRKIESRSSVFFLVTLLWLAVTATHPQRIEARADARRQSMIGDLPDYTYVLNPSSDKPVKYTLVISDSDEHTLSGTFTVEQLQVLKAVMLEAEKFAQTEEGVGTKEPITTRFADKQEASFVVDVEKLPNISRIYLTISTELGTLTAESGRVNRPLRRHIGFFFELLSRLESTLPKTAPARPK